MVQAARRAFCDSFIRELPQGYDTLVGERGVMLGRPAPARVSLGPSSRMRRFSSSTRPLRRSIPVRGRDPGRAGQPGAQPDGGGRGTSPVNAVELRPHHRAARRSHRRGRPATGAAPPRREFDGSGACRPRASTVIPQAGHEARRLAIEQPALAGLTPSSRYWRWNSAAVRCIATRRFRPRWCRRCWRPTRWAGISIRYSSRSTIAMANRLSHRRLQSGSEGQSDVLRALDRVVQRGGQVFEPIGLGQHVHPSAAADC